MRVVAFTPDYVPEAVVTTLMRGVVARLAENDAVVHGVRSSELHMSNVMGLRTLAMAVLRASCPAKAMDTRSTARAPILLTRKGQLLSRRRELVWSRHDYRNLRSVTAFAPPGLITVGCCAFNRYHLS